MAAKVAAGKRAKGAAAPSRSARPGQQQILLRVPTKLAKRFDRYAKRHKSTRNALICEAMERVLSAQAVDDGMSA